MITKRVKIKQRAITLGMGFFLQWTKCINKDAKRNLPQSYWFNWLSVDRHTVYVTSISLKSKVVK